jgi:hypothetical protein
MWMAHEQGEFRIRHWTGCNDRHWLWSRQSLSSLPLCHAGPRGMLLFLTVMRRCRGCGSPGPGGFQGVTGSLRLLPGKHDKWHVHYPLHP